ncbi:hypothetical protein [Gordonia sp. NPDC003422]
MPSECTEEARFGRVPVSRIAFALSDHALPASTITDEVGGWVG